MAKELRLKVVFQVGTSPNKSVRKVQGINLERLEGLVKTAFSEGYTFRPGHNLRVSVSEGSGGYKKTWEPSAAIVVALFGRITPLQIFSLCRQVHRFLEKLHSRTGFNQEEVWVECELNGR